MTDFPFSFPDFSPQKIQADVEAARRMIPHEEPGVLAGIGQDQPWIIIIAQFSDGSTACYWSTGEVSPETLIHAVRLRDRQATLHVYQRNDSPRYPMVGLPTEPFGFGWYVLADLADGPVPFGQPFQPKPKGPPRDPRLVKAERIYWHDHHPLEVVGTDCDTGERIERCQLYYILGPREEDATPFRTNKAARLEPARVRPTRQF